MAKKQTLKVDVFSGSGLTVGAFYKYSYSLVDTVMKTTSDKIDLSGLPSTMWSSVTQLGQLIKQQQAFEETAEVAAADYKRDRLLYFIYWTIYYAEHLDHSSLYYAAGHQLWVKVSPYKGIAAHELMKESSEVAGLIRAISDAESKASLEKLGLTQAVVELKNATTEITEAITAREKERGSRAADQGGLTTTKLRAEIWDEWQELADLVTAAYLYTQDAALKQTVIDLNGIVAHYRLVAAHTGKGQKGGDDETPDGGSDDGGSDDGGQDGGGSDDGTKASDE